MMVPTLLGSSSVVEAVKAAAKLMQDAAAPQADKDAVVVVTRKGKRSRRGRRY